MASNHTQIGEIELELASKSSRQANTAGSLMLDEHLFGAEEYAVVIVHDPFKVM